MKKLEEMLQIVTCLVLLIFITAVGAWFIFPRYLRWQFDHIESRAKKLISASELQRWATHLLAEYPSYSPWQVYQMRTNYPVRQFRSLCPTLGPLVSIYETPTGRCVDINWGGTPTGHGGFEIGPTNYVSELPHYYVHVWAPGVYFYREKD